MADNLTAYLMTVHFLPPLVVGLNGTEFTIRDESFARTGTLPWCDQVFNGSGFPDVQRLYVTVMPIRWGGVGVSGDVGYNQFDHPDTLMFGGPSTGPYTDTVTYMATRGLTVSDTIDPFTAPIAGWGHDPNHLTAWKATLALPGAAFKFRADTASQAGNCPAPF